MGVIVRILINAVAVYVAATFLDGVRIDGGGTAIIVALVLGFFNAFVKPVLKVLTFPITIVTLGLFLIVLNVLMVYATDYFITGFAVLGGGFDRFITALLFSLIVSAVSWLIDAVVN
jgi:putative membrane protein